MCGALQAAAICSGLSTGVQADKKRVEKKRKHSDKKKTRGKVGKGDW